MLAAEATVKAVTVFAIIDGFGLYQI